MTAFTVGDVDSGPGVSSRYGMSSSMSEGYW